MRPARGELPQDDLLAELKPAIDAVRIAHPVHGPNPSARRKLRRLITENPAGVRSFKVLYNLGRERGYWFMELAAHELGVEPRSIISPWKDDWRANGPLKGGHADRGDA